MVDYNGAWKGEVRACFSLFPEELKRKIAAGETDKRFGRKTKEINVIFYKTEENKEVMFTEEVIAFNEGICNLLTFKGGICNLLKVLRCLSSSRSPLSNIEISIKTGVSVRKLPEILNFLNRYGLVVSTSYEHVRGRYNNITEIGRSVLDAFELIYSECELGRKIAGDITGGKTERYIEFVLRRIIRWIKDIRIILRYEGIGKKPPYIMEIWIKCDYLNRCQGFRPLTCKGVMGGLAKSIANEYDLKGPLRDENRGECYFEIRWK